MCNPVTIFMPAVSREHQPSWRGFAAAACACAAAAVSTQMFLCPFPKCSPKCRDFSRGNKSTCTHRAFWTLFSHWFLNKSWCSLVNLSSQEWVEGFRDWTKPRRQSKPKRRLQPQCSGRDREWAAEVSLRKWWVLPQRSHLEDCAWLQGTRSSSFFLDFLSCSVSLGGWDAFLPPFVL